MKLQVGDRIFQYDSRTERWVNEYVIKRITKTLAISTNERIRFRRDIIGESNKYPFVQRIPRPVSSYYPPMCIVANYKNISIIREAIQRENIVKKLQGFPFHTLPTEVLDKIDGIIHSSKKYVRDNDKP